MQNKGSGKLITCMCEALTDDNNNHVVGVGASGHNKYVSTKTCLSMVFMFFLF